jgi:hypothetical protein
MLTSPFFIFQNLAYPEIALLFEKHYLATDANRLFVYPGACKREKLIITLRHKYTLFFHLFATLRMTKFIYCGTAIGIKKEPA